MKVVSGVFFLAFASLAAARSHSPYPNQNLAEFVVEKLDVTSIPSEFRPKREKQKITFADYGFRTRILTENDALLEGPIGRSIVSINVLEETSSGLYVCVNGQGPKANSEPIQRVFLLKWKDSNNLLKATESSKEFDGCPAIGGSNADSYGG